MASGIPPSRFHSSLPFLHRHFHVQPRSRIGPSFTCRRFPAQLRARIGPFECFTYRRFSEFLRLQTRLRTNFKRLSAPPSAKRLWESKLDISHQLQVPPRLGISHQAASSSFHLLSSIPLRATPFPSFRALFPIFPTRINILFHHTLSSLPFASHPPSVHSPNHSWPLFTAPLHS